VVPAGFATLGLRPTFPPRLEVVYAIDVSPFVEHSLRDVLKTLVEAMVLVFLVMLLFLQNVRATLIPAIAVPVVLLGTKYPAPSGENLERPCSSSKPTVSAC
jgi:multidrug efflux pump subunit AcrB